MYILILDVYNYTVEIKEIENNEEIADGIREL